MQKIGLLLPLGFGYSRGVVRGVSAYARAKRGWALTLLPYTGTESPGELTRRLRRQQLHGLVVQMVRPELLRAAQRVAPLVNVATPLAFDPPSVRSDNHAVGRLVAEHFLERRIRTLAFVGFAQQPFSRERQEGFQAAAQAAQCPSVAANVTSATLEMDLPRLLARWVRDFPRPLGVMACFDGLAARVLTICRRKAFLVPDEVALVGVDNDDLSCDLAPVPLSSVDLGTPRIGSEAARLLDDLLAGRRPPTRPLLLPPRGLVVRQSSDILAVDDPDVARAVRFIQEQAHRPLAVCDVVEAAAIGRRTLELRFSKLLARSIREEIYRAHLARARELLIGTDLPLPEVARRSGFRWAEHFSERFHRSVGLTPARFRRQYWWPTT